MKARSLPPPPPSIRSHVLYINALLIPSPELWSLRICWDVITEVLFVTRCYWRIYRYNDCEITRSRAAGDRRSRMHYRGRDSEYKLSLHATKWLVREGVQIPAWGRLGSMVHATATTTVYHRSILKEGRTIGFFSFVSFLLFFFPFLPFIPPSL